jgi:uncharacterized protein (TIGR02145 family)
MCKNLDITTYRNGDEIPEVADNTEWSALTTGAWCYYDNSSANGEVYGKMYNWYAVNDSRGLAPSGWHIPSDAEWMTLKDYLGGESVAGGKMKETGTSHWQSPNEGATNESGFTALPGGYRDGVGGSYGDIGRVGHWWSSTEFDVTHAGEWYLSYYYTRGIFGRSSLDKNGFSVRCIKD